MRVITPDTLGFRTGSKYLGVLVAAKYARSLNEFRRNSLFGEDAAVVTSPREKLTTVALGEVARGELDFRLVPRRSDDL